MYRLLLITCLTTLPAFAAEKLTVESGTERATVVELYTSEGCSSCPPADKWFEALTETRKQDVKLLALAFHVDYWDYIGWKDRFADPKYTNRQRQLGVNNRQQSIYTPEFFVDGKEARGTRNVLSQIKNSRNKQSPLNLRLSVSKNRHSLMVELQSTMTGTTTGPLQHRYFVYENNLSSDVKRGENAGKLLNHQQVVRYMSAPFESVGNDSHSIKINPDWRLDNIGIAALVTTPGNEHYIQAVYTPITSLLD
ncbi:MAG: hypothetical protein ACI9KN_000385 [Gammaproteobacteria bacterium]|jgi:hypothetical protein